MENIYPSYNKLSSRFISILLPIYNERENILPLLEEISSVMKKNSLSFEIIAVDDGSNDGSDLILKNCVSRFPELRVIFFRTNVGQTAALDAGFQNAMGDYIVTMDSDQQNDPNDIPSMIQKLELGADCVVGWRVKRKDFLFSRKIPSLIANWVIQKVCKTQLRDLGCSLKVYRSEITKEFRLYGEMHRFINILLEGIGAKVVLHKVNHRPRISGSSKYNLTRIYKVILDLITVQFFQSFRTKPIHVFGGIGILCLVFSGFLGGTAFYQKFFFELSINRNPLFYISIFLGILSVQFIALGLLAELMIRNYFESTGLTPYSIKEKLGFSGERADQRRISYKREIQITN